VAGLIPGAFDVADVQRTADTAADNAAIVAATQLKDHGLTAEGIGQEGEPESVIVDYAKIWGVDVIVAGSCDRPAIESRLSPLGIAVGETVERYGAEGTGLSVYFNDPEGNQIELKGPSKRPASA
jgi:nucleotide-binding universal stress UspA family protein